MFLHDICAHGNRAVGGGDRVALKTKIGICGQLPGKLDACHRNSREVDVLGHGHALDVTIAAIIAEQINRFEHLAHAQGIHVKHLVLTAQARILTDREVEGHPSAMRTIWWAFIVIGDLGQLYLVLLHSVHQLELLAAVVQTIKRFITCHKLDVLGLRHPARVEREVD